MEEKFNRTVLVTGASGYVATHCIQQLVKAGYSVVGTVRSLKNEQKILPITKLAGQNQDRLTLVQADLVSDKGWDQAMRNCDYVFHVASPVPAEIPQNQNEVIKPAVQGTRRVLNFAIKYNIKQVVVTSSIAAIMVGNKKDYFTEVDWSDSDGTEIPPYQKSKTLAQKQVWKIYQQNKYKIKITTINPGFIVGPAFYKCQSASFNVLVRLMNNDFPGIPKLSFPVVDVRDVALAHIRAIQRDNTTGKRYILTKKTYWMATLFKLVQNQFQKYGYKFPSMVFGKCPLTIASICDKQLKIVLPYLDRFIQFQNKMSQNQLDIDYLPIENTMVQGCYKVIQLGLAPNKLINKH